MIKKIMLCLIIILMFNIPAFGQGMPVLDMAEDIGTDTSSFDNNLSSADDTMQKALDTLDDMAGSGSISDEAYGTSWDGDTTTGASRNVLYDKIETLAGGHDPVTLDANADTLLSLSTQELGLDTQTANYILSGPLSGVDAVPSFRALVDDDIPNDITVNPINATTESAIEAVLDLQDMQGAVTDSQVPDDITITETDPNALLTADTDNIKDTHIDWGTGANQVSAVDIPIADSGSIITATDIEGALQENRTAIDLNTAKETNTDDQTASEVEMAELGTATYDDVQDWANNTQSSGIISGGAFTSNGDGSVTVAAGTGLIRATNSNIAEVMFFDWAEDTNVSLVDNLTNYIYVNYNSGSPIIGSTTSKADCNNRDCILLGKIFREGTDLHKVEAGMVVTELAKRVSAYVTQVFGEVTRASGFVIAETGNRYLTSTNGILMAGLTTVSTAGIDTSGADTMEVYYYDGDLATPAWVKTELSQLDNTYYNDVATGLVELTSNRYSEYFVYGCIDGDVMVVYGQGNHTLSEAILAQPPATLPSRVANFGFYAAKIIIQKAGTNFTDLVNIDYNYTLSSVVQNHNDLAGLQGGTAGEYYHVTSAEHTVIQNTSGINTGDNSPNTTYTIGSETEAWDADLDTWATVTPSANGQSLVSAADYAAMRGLLDLEAGTDFYSLSAEDTWRNGVTQTEMGYLHGVSSDIQTQLNAEASDTVKGMVELATSAEIDTGTDSTRAIPVDQFVASKRNIRWLVFNLVEAETDVTTATNIAGDFLSPIAGTILQSDTSPFYLYATNSTAGVTGNMVVDININGTSIMTTNKLSFDTSEKTTTTSGTPPDLTTTSLSVGDIITIDIDSIHTTAAKGLTVYMAIRE